MQSSLLSVPLALLAALTPFLGPQAPARVQPTPPAPPGAPALCDWAPTAAEVVVNTDFTTLNTSCGPISFAGGVFVLGNVHIPAGTTVRGAGTRPMIWVCGGDFTVDGTLSVRGGDGARVDTLNGANFPTPGGAGVCGGGDGGRGSPGSSARSQRGEPGNGPFNLIGLGGEGGRLSDVLACGRASGGGGGSFATQGDPYFGLKAGPNGSFAQQLGYGGYGCLGRSGQRVGALAGGNPGTRVFLDGRSDNDFFGLGLDLNRRLLIRGELPFAIGGCGGGGGGDRGLGPVQNWTDDEKGGGGGAGGGALLILVAGRIHIGASGRIVADGGNGGGGEQAGSNNQGAGGGGGSGGMVVLYAEGSIEIEAHGETYANGDYEFAISADGGLGTQGAFGGVGFTSKYPPLVSRHDYDDNPAGAFGGLGLIQLMAPAGSNQDRTNTILDDNIHVLSNGQRLTGGEKQRYLAWRGYPDANGTLVDDFGRPTGIGDDEGDLRPSPALLPVLR